MAALCKVTVRWVTSQNAKVLRRLPRKDGTGQGERGGKDGKWFKGEFVPGLEKHRGFPAVSGERRWGRVSGD